MKILKRIGWGFLALLVLFNIGVFLFGKTYFYTALAKTYFSGQGGPGIYDLDKFPARKIATKNTAYWRNAAGYNAKKIASADLEYLESVKTSALVLIKNGEILHESYYGESSDTTLSNSFSMAKSIVAMLAQIAHQEGFIADLNDPVQKYLKEFNHPGCEKVTLYHLMSMSSGLSWSESGGNPFSDNAEAYYGTDLVELVGRMRPVDEPGKEFIYKSGNTALLGFAIERAVGMSLSEYASQKIWHKLGAERDAFWSLDKEKGQEKSYCCWYATGRDFARIGQMMLQEGYFNGNQILDSSFVADARTAAPLQIEDKGENKRYSKRSFWLVQHKGHHYYYLRGILGQYIIILPEENAVFVRLGKKRGTVGEGGHPDDIYHYIDLAKDLLH